MTVTEHTQITAGDTLTLVCTLTNILSDVTKLVWWTNRGANMTGTGLRLIPTIISSVNNTSNWKLSWITCDHACHPDEIVIVKHSPGVTQSYNDAGDKFTSTLKVTKYNHTDQVYTCHADVAKTVSLRKAHVWQYGKSSTVLKPFRLSI